MKAHKIGIPKLHKYFKKETILFLNSVVFIVHTVANINTQEHLMTKLEQLKQYISEHPPNKKKSKFDSFYDLMVEMRQSGYSYREIATILSNIDVKAYPSEIKRFMDRRENKKMTVSKNVMENKKYHQQDYKDQFFEKFDNKEEQ